MAWHRGQKEEEKGGGGGGESDGERGWGRRFYTRQQKISELEEQMQRKQRRGKAVDTVPPQHKPVSAGEVPGGRCAAGPRPGCFLSLLCISETSGSLCAPEDQEGCSKGGG